MQLDDLCDWLYARTIRRLEATGTKAGYAAAEEYRSMYAAACSGRDGPDSDLAPAGWDDEETADAAAHAAAAYGMQG